MLRHLPLCALALSAGLQSPALTAQENFYGVSPRTGSPALYEIDGTTGATISAVNVVVPGRTVTGCNGLDVDPNAGTVYAVCKVSGQQSRILVTLQQDGSATEMGDTGLKIASLAFDDEGVLWALTGDGGNPSETLFTLDKETGFPTEQLRLGNGDDGESLSFNPDDGLLYHTSGLGTGTEVFEAIDPNTLAVVDIPISQSTSEVWGLMYIGDDTFQFTNINNNVGFITTDGTVTITAAAHAVDLRGIMPQGAFDVVPDELTGSLGAGTCPDPLPAGRFACRVDATGTLDADQGQRYTIFLRVAETGRVAFRGEVKPQADETVERAIKFVTVGSDPASFTLELVAEEGSVSSPSGGATVLGTVDFDKSPARVRPTRRDTADR